MLLLKFEFDDLEKCKTVDDVYKTMGVDGDLYFTNKSVFGKKAYYKNLFIADETFKKVHEVLEKAVEKKYGKKHKRFVGDVLFTWCSYAPISSGPRFEQVEELVGGEINRSVLYILTPEDELYEEAPDV